MSTQPSTHVGASALSAEELLDEAYRRGLGPELLKFALGKIGETSTCTCGATLCVVRVGAVETFLLERRLKRDPDTHDLYVPIHHCQGVKA
jgi:hypothetical protein